MSPHRRSAQRKGVMKQANKSSTETEAEVIDRVLNRIDDISQHEAKEGFSEKHFAVSCVSHHVFTP